MKAKAPKAKAPSGATVSQVLLAERLGLGTRQIRNLVDAGMPRVMKGGKAEYPWPGALTWYIEDKVARAIARTGDAKASVWSRKAELEIKLAELEVAKAQEQVITIDYAAAQWEQMLFLLRARAVAGPTRWMDEFIGLPDARASRKKLDEFITELLTSLADAGDDSSLDDIEEEEAPSPEDAG